MKIAHISDVHFGRIAHPGIVPSLIEDINKLHVDLVVVSGDLTQRARARQFVAAAEMIAAFDAPVLVVPGNHDVYAWWHPVARMTAPLQRYRRYITDDLTPTFEAEDVAVLGINSAFGRTVKGGRIDKEAQTAIDTFFGGKGDEVFKVLVLHHHLTKIHALGRHDVARHAQRTLDQAHAAGVDLILCGHLHISHIEPLEIIPGEHRIVIASAGTATSSRGRKSNRDTNFYNLIAVEPEHFTIEERRFNVAEKQFEVDHSSHFTR